MRLAEVAVTAESAHSDQARAHAASRHASAHVYSQPFQNVP